MTSVTPTSHGPPNQASRASQAVLAKPARPDPSLMYPPYTEAKKKLMRRFF